MKASTVSSWGGRTRGWLRNDPESELGTRRKKKCEYIRWDEQTKTTEKKKRYPGWDSHVYDSSIVLPYQLIVLNILQKVGDPI